MILPRLERGQLQRVVGLAVGETGSGKSTFLRGVMKEYLVRGRRRVLAIEHYPHKCEFGGTPIRGGKQLAAVLGARPVEFFISYYPDTDDDPRELDRISRLCWWLGDMLLVADELSSFFDAGQPVPPYFKQLVKRGRHAPEGPVSILAADPAPYYLPKLLRREAQFIAAFSLSEDTDRKWVADYPGGRGAAPQLEKLAHHDYLLIERGQEPKPCRARNA